MSEASGQASATTECFGVTLCFQTADQKGQECGPNFSWPAPPTTLKKLLSELFSQQPLDVLSWMHTAVWQLHAEELTSSKWKVPGDLEQPEIFAHRAEDIELGFASMRGESTLASATVQDSWRRPTVVFDEHSDSTVDQPVADEMIQRDDQTTGTPIDRISKLSSREATASSAGSETSMSGGRDSRERQSSVELPAASSFTPMVKISLTGLGNSTARVPSAVHDYGTASLASWCVGSDGMPDDLPGLTCGGTASTPAREFHSHQTSRKRTLRSLRSMQSTASRTASSVFHRVWHTSKFDGTVSHTSTMESGKSHSTEENAALFEDLLSMRKMKTFKVWSSPAELVGLPSDMAKPASHGLATWKKFNRWLWNTLFIACILLEFWAATLVLVFLPEISPRSGLPRWMWTASCVTLTVYCIDIALNCFVVQSVGDIKCKTRCCWNSVLSYVKSWFLFDFALALTQLLDVVMHDLEAELLSRLLILHRFLRVVRLTRLAEWSAIFKDLLLPDRVYVSWPWLSKLFRVQGIMFLTSHINACCWAALQPESWQAHNATQAYERYLECLWWAYTSLSFGGSNDDSPYTPSQQAFCMLLAAERLVVLALLVSEIQRPEVQTSQNVKHEMLRYLRRRHVSPALRSYVLKKVQEKESAWKWQKRSSEFRSQDLEESLMDACLSEMWSSDLLRLELIQRLSSLSSTFIEELARVVAEVIQAPSTILYSCGERSSTAYAILRGQVAIQFSAHPHTKDYLQGMWVGEQALVNPEIERAETLMSRTQVDLLSIPGVQFAGLISSQGLTEQFSELCGRTLWLGLCGRCGSLGDHFSFSCPTVGNTEEDGEGYGEVDRANNLAEFLARHNLQALAGACERLHIKNIESLAAMPEDELIQKLRSDLTPGRERKLRRTLHAMRRMAQNNAKSLLVGSVSLDNHLIFLSHFKKEAGTEASILQENLENRIKTDANHPAQHLMTPVFIDSDNLTDLETLESHVSKSHNLVLLLTPGVLTRPWVLVEVVTALRTGTYIVPVEIQRPDLVFVFPEEAYFQRLRKGQELDSSAEEFLRERGIALDSVESALRQVFKHIAIPFSPHKAAAIRAAEVDQIMKQCCIRKTREDMARNFQKSIVFSDT